MDDTLERLGETIASALAGSIAGHWIAHGELTLPASARDIIRVMTFLRDDERCQFYSFIDITAVDWPARERRFDVVYHLLSPRLNQRVRVKLETDEASPVASAVEVFSAANWFEREAYDLFGLIYLGHSDLRRIMLPDDWVGHPLRKDYTEAEDYHGIGTTRSSPLEAFKQMDATRKKAREEKGIIVEQQKSPVKPPEGWVKPGKKGAVEEEEEAAE